ncbi:hypothetical protein CNMCM5793_006799 [Aspergillus hiratsukae]|uniref:L-tryptophan decarboxylase PsiD-like domain-containing protein n=1 Tax=Aspergillus hiratsukae TaxID=1194566 RepID=A0A8H6P4T1_9EURO|nr:hypothetical protein CNMCM5793_006799 [Aspergillus hiratsukae]
MQKFYLSAYAKPSLGGLATGSATHGYGQWMPETVELRRAWLSHLLDKAKPEIPQMLRDGKENPVDALKNLVENNSTIYMLAHSMFDEVPEKAHTIGTQPHSRNNGLIGFPFNIIVDWPMGTESGRQFFLDPRVNEALKAILNKWGEFLSNPKGRTGKEGGGNQALIDAGWSSEIAVKQLEKKANDATPGSTRMFTELFEHPAGGTQENFFNYPHWDAFFTRKFRADIRPVGTAALVNACESFPLSFDTDVSGRTTFWLKGMPYSLYDMLGATQDPTVSQYVDKFVGGTVYQAFLSADSYHCWNAPVNGKVVYRSLIDGTYFAETAAAGFGGSSGPDPAGPDVSQRYITHIAARGVLIVDTNVENGSQIGLVAFLPVGMSEVSTCQWEESTAPGNTITQGDLIGAFHSGGSTHCLIFEREYARQLKFNPKAQEIATVNLAVNSTLATLQGRCCLV